MTTSISSTAKPVIRQYLTALAGVLDKAAAHARATNAEESAFLQARLYPDMFAMARQVQITCDLAVRGASRLANSEPPSFADEESSFEELKERISIVLKHLDGLSDADLDAAAERDVTFPTGPDSTMTLAGPIYLYHFLLPNVFFHATTAYGLLRHSGVELGKRDFVGEFPQ